MSEQIQTNIHELSSERKANFTVPERQYGDKLRDELVAIKNGRTFRQIFLQEGQQGLDAILDKKEQIRRWALYRERYPDGWDKKRLRQWLIDETRNPFFAGHDEKTWTFLVDEKKHGMLNDYKYDEEGNIVYQGNICWQQYPFLKRLPRSFIVNGNFDVSETEIEFMSDKLIVNGKLIMNHCDKLVILPRELIVAKDLDIAYSPAREMPHILRVGGSMCLVESEAISLPEDTEIKGILFLQDCRRELEEHAQALQKAGKIHEVRIHHK